MHGQGSDRASLSCQAPQAADISAPHSNHWSRQGPTHGASTRGKEQGARACGPQANRVLFTWLPLMLVVWLLATTTASAQNATGIPSTRQKVIQAKLGQDLDVLCSNYNCIKQWRGIVTAALVVLPPSAGVSSASILQSLFLDVNVTSNARVSIVRPLVRSISATTGVYDVMPTVNLGIGVRVYVVDTGIRASHQEFRQTLASTAPQG